MTTLRALQQRASERINRLRRVQRLIETEDFAFAWSSATPLKQKELTGWIHLGNITLLELWLTRANRVDLEIMSMRQLRTRASRSSIPYYGKLSRSELIWEITNAEANTLRLHQCDQSGNGTLRVQVGQGKQESV